MDIEFKAHVAFHLTGKNPAGGLEALGGLEFRPALLAGYRDLTRLRYDFPLVLCRSSSHTGRVQSLSGLVNALLRDLAPQGVDGEQSRKHLLRLEREIRTLVAGGAAGSLSALWDAAAGRLASESDATLRENIDRARAALTLDGEVVDCDDAMPARLFTHAWNTVQQAKARAFRERIDRLLLKLSDVLAADHVRSEAGRSAESLKAAFGPAHEPVFDFEAMSRLLARVSARDTLPDSRRRRILWARSALETQRFVTAAGRRGEADLRAKPYSFAFESCTEALKAFRKRLPEVIKLVKAVAIAELEIDGRYVESLHDGFFDGFDENALGAGELTLLPDYLVCLRAANMQPAEYATLMEILSSGLPVKVLVQTDDLLEESSILEGHVTFSARTMRLASTAIGLNDVFVLQSASSHLFQLREGITKGLAHPGAALFSVYSGSAGQASELPPYLAAAAAMQSRAFPAFVYDPSAGPDWVSRFSLEGNPQPDRDWPLQNFSYEDAEHQRMSEDLAFSFVDFAACDRRYARHFANVPRANWNDSMVPVTDCLAHDTGGSSEQVPYLLMVDGHDALHKVIVDDKLILAARRCGEIWRSLQELGGIHNSHAEALLARERKAWEEQKQREIEALRREAAPVAQAATAAQAAAPAAAAAPAQAEAEEEERPSDDPYIETPRCTSCDECTQLNNRMFAYDANKQAYIANLNAGTYRELVEAAESCQVSIIHPGKPRDPNEPGLDELIKRAEPFL